MHCCTFIPSFLFASNVLYVFLLSHQLLFPFPFLASLSHLPGSELHMGSSLFFPRGYYLFTGKIISILYPSSLEHHIQLFTYFLRLISDKHLKHFGLKLSSFLIFSTSGGIPSYIYLLTVESLALNLISLTYSFNKHLIEHLLAPNIHLSSMILIL